MLPRRQPPIRLDPERELAELREYLGPAYRHEHLVDWDRTLEEEYARVGDEQRLYRSSEAYLYNLTAFAMSATKLPYLRDLTSVVPPPARLLDYGCGIGSDGLVLIEAGYRVAFADFDNPSVEYLRWRLRRRGLDAQIYDIDCDGIPGNFDAAYSFDVIEHVEDPFGFLSALEARARLVAVNFLDPEPGETALHHDLPVTQLIRHAASRSLLRYRRYHGRSHLVIYGPLRRSAGARLRAKLALWRGRRA